MAIKGGKTSRKGTTIRSDVKSKPLPGKNAGFFLQSISIIIFIDRTKAVKLTKYHYSLVGTNPKRSLQRAKGTEKKEKNGGQVLVSENL